MQTIPKTKLSRRSLVAGMTGLCLLPRSESVSATPEANATPVPAVELGEGLEIRDYRLFPSDDVLRFIVEIHNTSDTALDTPSVGVVLPHLEDGENFGWANPIGQVIYPQSSQGLVGVAPGALTSDDDWGTPEWMLCSSVETRLAERIQHLDIELEWDFRIREPDEGVSLVVVTNHGTEPTPPLGLSGLLWDSDGRLCGSTISRPLPVLAPGEVFEIWFTIWERYSHAANSFALVELVENLSVTYFVQPRDPAVNQGCPVLFEWSP